MHSLLAVNLLDIFCSFRLRRSGGHVSSTLPFGGIKKKTSLSVRVDPITSHNDHTDSLSIPLSQYTGATTFNIEGSEKEAKQDQSNNIAISLLAAYLNLLNRSSCKPEHLILLN